jgi:HPt (histidine-containing phosphotransfer) domain-containing protein
MSDDHMARMRLRFRERALQDARALEDALHDGPAGMAEIASLAHGLAGMAGMFGHTAIGEAATAIDRVFADEERPSPEMVRALVAIIDREVGGHS